MLSPLVGCEWLKPDGCTRVCHIGHLDVVFPFAYCTPAA
jgi:hypothetical protein